MKRKEALKRGKMKNFLKNSRGITLIEIIVAALLVTVVAVSLLAMASQSSVFSRRIDIAYTASYLAQRRIDVLKRLEFDHLPESVETTVQVDVDGTVSSEGEYLRTTEVETDFDGNPYLTKVKVSVQKVKLNIDGSIMDVTSGSSAFMGDAVVMETLFSDIE